MDRHYIDANSYSKLTISQDILAEVLAGKDQLWLKVLSGSMAPIAPVGSKVLIKPISDRKGVHFGDIIVFQNGDKLIIHRILGRRRNGQETLYLQGGDNYCQPSLVKENQVLGKVFAVQKNGQIIKLDAFRGRLLSTYFAVVTKTKYHLDEYISLMKFKVFRGRKIIFLSFASRIVRVSLRFLTKVIAKLLMGV